MVSESEKSRSSTWSFTPQPEDTKQWTGIRPSWAQETEYNTDDWDERSQLVNRPG